jgi:hypothetical protein
VADELLAELERRSPGRKPVLTLVAPAIADTRFQHVMGGVDEGIEEARVRLERSVERLQDGGFEVADARVGDADPIEAISDAVLEREGTYDEIVLVVHPESQQRPFEEAEFERARERFQLPLTYLEVTRSSVEEEQHAEPEERETEGEIGSETYGLPRLTALDVAAMGVGVLGTLVLIVLAANCASEMSRTELEFGGCQITVLLAGAFFLINLAHVIGLTMFQTTRYRGFFEKFFAGVSLYGTSAAVLVALLIS